MLCCADPVIVPSMGQTSNSTTSISKLFGFDKPMDRLALARRIDEGLPLSTLVAFRAHVGDRLFEKAVPKARERRLRSSGRPLSVSTAERLYRLAVIYIDVLRIYRGDEEAAAGFLLRPHMMLRDMAPIDLAVDSSSGLDAVRDVLAGLRFGFAA